jgi:hypothetical protein
VVIEFGFARPPVKFMLFGLVQPVNVAVDFSVVAERFDNQGC